ncbi:tetratricopeptide repeat protein [Ancylobacter sp. 6x-1]|uniref:Tetratricopeptide repeat protein n=1 Tax=Ancylobacter crimeensis TaxID=2579147 RepID=A0ABT0D7S9_9HYPH|nr:tetratricopeptide repeat protein [Ancylobacter crimeensis]MCK0195997.1 tetratricopeptide repeat protein [Ancylobacter crimeensis]
MADADTAEPAFPEAGLAEAEQGTPSSEAVRAALVRVLDSEELRSSPQLSNILRFVVEARLEGRQEAIKGYTIAVEALGRDPSFDPQADPIVRVEATRLRRALERYYAGNGATDEITILVPRGSYVPQFLLRHADATPAVQGEVEDGTVAPEPGAAPFVAPLLPESGAPPVAADTVPPRADPENGRRHSRSWIMLGFVVVFALVVGLAGLMEGLDPAGWRALLVGAALQHPLERTNRLGIPMVEVLPFEATGGSTPAEHGGVAIPAGEFDARAIETRVRDALARFDLLDVLASPEVRPSVNCGDGEGRLSSAFSLGGLVENHDDGSVAVLLRLADVCDGTIVWSREFESLRRGNDPTATEIALVRDIMVAIAEPYGIIQARARARIAAANAPLEAVGPYGCILVAYNYWRSYIPADHARARDCLERAVGDDPGFSVGFSVLAELYLDEVRNGANARTDTPALNRALAAAEQAVDLAPTSAYARRVLMDVHFFRGERGPAIAAGDAALELNPYDVDISAGVGGRLVAYGELDRGEALLTSAKMIAPGSPPSIDFHRVIAAYLRGDVAAATAAADHLIGEGYAPGLLARALASHIAGDDDSATQDLQRLVALAPDWASDTDVMVARFFPDPSIAKRVRTDLAAAGLPIRHAQAARGTVTHGAAAQIGAMPAPVAATP